jgi:hypothetical protein
VEHSGQSTTNNLESCEGQGIATRSGNTEQAEARLEKKHMSFEEYVLCRSKRTRDKPCDCCDAIVTLSRMIATSVLMENGSLQCIAKKHLKTPRTRGLATALVMRLHQGPATRANGSSDGIGCGHASSCIRSKMFGCVASISHMTQHSSHLLKVSTAQ